MRIVRLLLFPISLLYGFVVFVRNLLYDVGILKSISYETPTICVGNLSVGGTGKTPMIAYLIEQLKEKYQLAVLSRGYRRTSDGFIIADTTVSVGALGDEPYQLYTTFPDVSVAVDRNRGNGILELEKKIQPDLILLDDAFQHRKVLPSFAILLTAYDEMYATDWYLPTGNLRDSKTQAKRADCIVVTKCPASLSASKKQEIEKKLALREEQTLFFSHLIYAVELRGDKDSLRITDLLDKKLALVTGIANPKPLLEYLKSEKLLVTHFSFKDHHNYGPKDYAKFKNFEYVLTTAKDYSKLRGKLKNLYVVGVAHSFEKNDKEQLLQQLEWAIKRPVSS